MSNLRNLFKLPVLTVESGQHIGVVEEIIVDFEMTSIKAVLISKPDFTGKNIKLSVGLGSDEQNLFGVIFENLWSIGADAVMVRTQRYVEDLSLFCQSDFCRCSSELFDKPIYTETGFSLGVLADIIFDETTGEIKAYQISDGLLSDLLYGRSFMPLPKAQVISSDMLIVPDKAASLIYT